MYSCQQCSNNDIRNFQYFPNEDWYVCMECGLVCTDLCDAQVVEEYCKLVVPQGKKPFQNSFNRRVHIMERISATQRKDPEICQEDALQLQIYHELYQERDYFYRERAKAKCLNKKDIQKLLRFVDKLEKENGKKWCKLYLEKWNSILEILEGIQLPTYSYEEIARIVSLLLRFSNLWDIWQPPTDRETRERWKYKDRKHFINYNFAFQKMHKLLNIKGKNMLYPKPTTIASLKKLEKYWQDMCMELGLPVDVTKQGQPIYLSNKKRKQLTLTGSEPPTGTNKRQTVEKNIFKCNDHLKQTAIDCNFLIKTGKDDNGVPVFVQEPSVSCK